MLLPDFRYHPDSIDSGSIAPSPDPCLCCGNARGSIYEAARFHADGP